MYVNYYDNPIYNETINRKQFFEYICKKQFDRVAQIVCDAVTHFRKWAMDNRKEPRIHRIFLFGGSSQNAIVTRIAQQALEPNNGGKYQMEESVIPEDAVALGAAVLADQYYDSGRLNAIPNCVLEPLHCIVNGVNVRIANVGDYLPITYGQHPLNTLNNSTTNVSYWSVDIVI